MLNVHIEDDQLKFQYFVSNQSESTQLLWRQDTKIFPARWMLIGQFKFQARQPYARTPLKVRMKGGNQLGHLCEAYMKRTTMSCIVG